jgi:hypothetical protein
MPKKETDERIAAALERIAASLDELNRHAERLTNCLDGMVKALPKLRSRV